MGKIKIDKDIKMDEETRGRPAIYPFKEMEIGDSIFIEGSNSVLESAKASAHAYAKKTVASVWNGKTWTPTGRKRFVTKRENGGMRIGRVRDRPFEDWELTEPIDGARWLKDEEQ